MLNARVIARDGNILTVSFGKNRAKEARALYARASELDEDRCTMTEALSLYMRAVQLDPALAIAYTNIGNVYYRRDDDADEAHKWYSKALEVDEHQPEAHYNLGYCAARKRQWSLAIWLTKKAIALDPTFADAYFQLADVLEKSGESQRAKVYWKRFLELSPNGEWSKMATERLEARGS